MIHYEYVKASLKSIEQLAEDLSDKYEQQILELQAAMQRLREKAQDKDNVIAAQQEEIKSLRLVLNWTTNKDKGLHWTHFVDDVNAEMGMYLEACQEYHEGMSDVYPIEC